MMTLQPPLVIAWDPVLILLLIASAVVWFFWKSQRKRRQRGVQPRRTRERREPTFGNAADHSGHLHDSAADMERREAAIGRSDYAATFAPFVKQGIDLAADGDAEAQNILGAMYENGRGVPQDYAQAAAWYRKAAEQGLADAQYNLGVLYYSGQGVPQDYAQTVALLSKAAAQGLAVAQFNLGAMYHKGQGVPRSFAKAAAWYRKAAAQGHADAQASLRG